MNDHIHPIMREALAPFAPPALRPFLVRIKCGPAVVTEFAAMGPDSCTVAARHEDLCELGQYLQVVPADRKEEPLRLMVVRNELEAAQLREVRMAPEFLVDGTRYSLAEMLESNADSPEVCAWARRAVPGDVFEDLQRVQCVAPGQFSQEELEQADLSYLDDRKRRDERRLGETLDLERAYVARRGWAL